MKRVALIFSIVLLLSLLVGCENNPYSDKTPVDETVIVIFEGKEYEELTVSDTQKIYLDLSANFEVFDPTLILSKSETHVSYFESTITYQNLYIKHNNEMISLDNALSSQLITLNSLSNCECVGYFYQPIGVNESLLEAIQELREHLSIDGIENSEGEFSSTTMTFLENVDEEYDPFFQWDNKYEWYMNVDGFYALLESFVELGYIEGTVVPMSDYITDNNSHFIRDNYKIYIEAHDEILTYRLFRDRDSHYEYKYVTEVSTNIAYIKDNELIYYFTAQIFDENLNEFYRSVEEWREFSGIARTSYDDAFQGYASYISSGVKLNDTTNIQWNATTNEFGLIRENWDIEVLQDETMYIDIYFSDDIYEYLGVENRYQGLVHQENNVSQVANMSGVYQNRYSIYEGIHHMFDHYASGDVYECYDIIETTYLWYDEDKTKSLIEELMVLREEIRTMENILEIPEEDWDEDQRNIFNTQYEKLIAYEIAGKSYNMMGTQNGENVIDYNRATTAAMSIRDDRTNILERMNDSYYSGITGKELLFAKLDIFPYLTNLMELDPSIIIPVEGEFMVLNIDTFKEKFINASGFSDYTYVYFTYDTSINGAIPNDETAIENFAMQAIQSVRDKMEVFTTFSDIKYHTLDKESFIEATNHLGFTFGTAFEDFEDDDDDNET